MLTHSAASLPHGVVRNQHDTPAQLLFFVELAFPTGGQGHLPGFLTTPGVRSTGLTQQSLSKWRVNQNILSPDSHPGFGEGIQFAVACPLGMHFDGFVRKCLGPVIDGDPRQSHNDGDDDDDDDSDESTGRFLSSDAPHEFYGALVTFVFLF